jgi:hypothetical protein
MVAVVVVVVVVMLSVDRGTQRSDHSIAQFKKRLKKKLTFGGHITSTGAAAKVKKKICGKIRIVSDSPGPDYAGC